MSCDTEGYLCRRLLMQSLFIVRLRNYYYYYYNELIPTWWRQRLSNFFPPRSVLAVTVERCESSAPTGWVKTPPTNFLKWFWLTHSTRPSDATQTPNGSQRLCTSTEKCVAWHLQARRAVAWARATSSISPLEAPAVQPGRGATLCSCTATVSVSRVCTLKIIKCPFYGDDPVVLFVPLAVAKGNY